MYAVRSGLGATLFPVGWEFETLDADTGATITWVVRGHDHHQAADSRYTHTMTLETKYVYGTAAGTHRRLVFDAAEAIYYCAEALPAGTYNFVWSYTAESVVAGTFQFTITQGVPAGGQIVISGSGSSSALTARTIATYAGIGATTAIESNITITEGSGGTNLGTVNSATSIDDNLNCGQHVLVGSNNYAQSAIRQWLNSANAAGAVWNPTNKFDRPPTWATSYNGFMHGLPADFLAAVQPAAVPCRTNGVYEVPSLDGTEFTVNTVYELEDKFFLLSRPEIYGTYDSKNYKDGEQLEYYEGLTSTELIKRDAAGSACASWLRSPLPSSAYLERYTGTGGSLYSNSAITPYSVAPACIIA